MIGSNQDARAVIPETVMHDIQNLNQEYIQRWWDLDTNDPDLGITYTLREKFPRERALETFLNDLVNDLSDSARTRAELSWRPGPHPAACPPPGRLGPGFFTEPVGRDRT
jgi:hypothetical protein